MAPTQMPSNMRIIDSIKVGMFWLLMMGIGAMPALAQKPMDFGAFQKKWFIQDGDTLPYRILYPETFDQGVKYPLFLFLHGAGERGNDNEAQLIHGASLFLDPHNRQRYPCIVVFPQCQAGSSWSRFERVAEAAPEAAQWETPFYENPTTPMRLVLALLDSLVQSGRVDVARIYVSGLSMGGFGTFDLLARRPGFFAAAAPICGGGNSLLVKLYGPNTPIWLFHGAKDSVVPVENSRKMYRALKAVGAEVRYTEYPDYDHNSWDGAFAEPDFLSWFFKHRL